MSVFARAAPKYPPIPQELIGLLNSLYRARDDEDEKRKVEALIRPLLTSQSVNSVYGDGYPTLASLARYSSSLLTVALQLEPDPDIISQSLHLAIREPETTPSSVKALVDAGGDVNFNPLIFFTDEELPEAFAKFGYDSPLSCMFSCTDFEKDDPATAAPGTTRDARSGKHSRQQFWQVTGLRRGADQSFELLIAEFVKTCLEALAVSRRGSAGGSQTATALAHAVLAVAIVAIVVIGLNLREKVGFRRFPVQLDEPLRGRHVLPARERALFQTLVPCQQGYLTPTSVMATHNPRTLFY